MRTILTICLSFSATDVLAHVGHIADAAGHNHWVAGAVIGLAALAGLYGALKGKSEAEEPDADEIAEDEVPA